MLWLFMLNAGEAQAAAPTRVFSLLSEPPGAQVYDDMGNLVCTTPCELSFPQWAFRAPALITARRLNTAIAYVVGMPGFEPETFYLTDGPLRWVSLNGENQFDYYVIRSFQGTVHLRPVRDEVQTAAARPCAVGFGKAADGNCYPIVLPSTNTAPELPPQDVAAASPPTAIELRGTSAEADGSGAAPRIQDPDVPVPAGVAPASPPTAMPQAVEPVNMSGGREPRALSIDGLGLGAAIDPASWTCYTDEAKCIRPAAVAGLSGVLEVTYCDARVIGIDFVRYYTTDATVAENLRSWGHEPVPYSEASVAADFDTLTRHASADGCDASEVLGTSGKKFSSVAYMCAGELRLLSRNRQGPMKDPEAVVIRYGASIMLTDPCPDATR